MDDILLPILSTLDAIYNARCYFGENMDSSSLHPSSSSDIEKVNTDLIKQCRLFCFIPDNFVFWE